MFMLQLSDWKFWGLKTEEAPKTWRHIVDVGPPCIGSKASIPMLISHLYFNSNVLHIWDPIRGVPRSKSPTTFLGSSIPYAVFPIQLELCARGQAARSTWDRYCKYFIQSGEALNQSSLKRFLTLFNCEIQLSVLDPQFSRQLLYDFSTTLSVVFEMSTPIREAPSACLFIYPSVFLYLYMYIHKPTTLVPRR